MHPPIFRESRKTVVDYFSVVIPVMTAQPELQQRGEYPERSSGTGGLEPITQAPLPVTVQVADRGR